MEATYRFDVWSTTRLGRGDRRRLHCARSSRSCAPGSTTSTAPARASAPTPSSPRCRPGTHRLSPLLADLVGTALDAAEASGGLVDPTIGGTLLDLGYDRSIELLPGGRRARTVVPHRAGLATRAAARRPPRASAGDVVLDLGATAKARAADLLAARAADDGGRRRAGRARRRHRHGRTATGRTGGRCSSSDSDEDPACQVTLAAGLRRSPPRRRSGVPGAAAASGSTTSSTRAPRRRPSPSGAARTVAAPTCVEANTAATAAIVLGTRGHALARRAWAHRAPGRPAAPRRPRRRRGRRRWRHDHRRARLRAVGVRPRHRRRRAGAVHRSRSCSASSPAPVVRVPWLGRFGASDLHRTAALTGTGLVAVHVGGLLFDPYAQLKARRRRASRSWRATGRLWLGLGTLAVDLLGVITVRLPAACGGSGRGCSGPCTGRRTRCGRSLSCTPSAPAPTPAPPGSAPSPRSASSLWSSPRSAGASRRRTPAAAGPVIRGGPHDRTTEPGRSRADARRILDGAGPDHDAHVARYGPLPRPSASTPCSTRSRAQRPDRARRRGLPDRRSRCAPSPRAASARSWSGNGWRASRSARRTRCSSTRNPAPRAGRSRGPRVAPCARDAASWPLGPEVDAGAGASRRPPVGVWRSSHAHGRLRGGTGDRAGEPAQRRAALSRATRSPGSPSPASTDARRSC